MVAAYAVLSCPHVSIFHYRAPNLHDERYMTNSLRFKEAAYARHFCLAFRQVSNPTPHTLPLVCSRAKLGPTPARTHSGHAR